MGGLGRLLYDYGIGNYGYAIGRAGEVFPEGSGRLIKAGSKINLQFHLHSSGEEIRANVMLGLKLYPKNNQPKHRIDSLSAVIMESEFWRRGPNVRSDIYMPPLNKPARLLSFQPHMHNRGKVECLEAIYPYGTTEMLNCAGLLSNWHVNYVYADNAAPLLPTGTVLHSIMWHNNTIPVEFNPDPDTRITWLNWYYMSEQEFEKEIAARKARLPKLTSPP
jgi:hypothetical protein